MKNVQKLSKRNLDLRIMFLLKKKSLFANLRNKLRSRSESGHRHTSGTGSQPSGGTPNNDSGRKTRNMVPALKRHNLASIS